MVQEKPFRLLGRTLNDKTFSEHPTKNRVRCEKMDVKGIITKRNGKIVKKEWIFADGSAFGVYRKEGLSTQ